MKRWLAFLQSDAGSAVPLLAAAVLALVLANSPLGAGRRATSCTSRSRTKSLAHWINDGLMVVFFLLVGMEIKREVVAGELSRPSQVALPIAGALGGILVPAVIYAASTGTTASRCTAGRSPRRPTSPSPPPSSARSAPRVPPALKLFLLTLAIVDDLAAIAHHRGLLHRRTCRPWRSRWPGCCILVLVALNALGVRRICPICWSASCSGCACSMSGVHATLAGVVLAFCLPLGDAFDRLEHVLKPWVLFLVLPLFAFANSGLDLGGLSAAMVRDPIVIGIVAGLFLGKQLGIFAGAASLIALRRGAAAGRRDLAAALWRRACAAASASP